MATTADGRSAAIKRRIAATTRRPSALGYSARCGCVESSGAATELGPSVRSLAAEELAHLIVELLHAGVDRRRLLDLLGSEDLAHLEGGGQPLAHQGGTRLRLLLHQRIEVVLRDRARAEQLVGDRLPGRSLVRAELGERRPVLPDDVMHSLLLVGAQVEGMKHAASARQSTVAAGIAPAHAVAERARAAGDRQRERAGRKEGLRHRLRHGSSPCSSRCSITVHIFDVPAVIALAAVAGVRAVVLGDGPGASEIRAGNEGERVPVVSHRALGRWGGRVRGGCDRGAWRWTDAGDGDHQRECAGGEDALRHGFRHGLISSWSRSSPHAPSRRCLPYLTHEAAIRLTASGAVPRSWCTDGRPAACAMAAPAMRAARSPRALDACRGFESLYAPPRATRSGPGPAAARSEAGFTPGGTTITKRTCFPNCAASFSVATRRSRQKPLMAPPQSSARYQPSPSIHTPEP